MRSHELARTTHTPEMQQLGELNARLRADLGYAVTSRDLGIAGTQLEPRPRPVAGIQWSTSDFMHERLPASSVLDHISIDGPPDFPYVHGHFRPAPGRGTNQQVVSMHTEALRELSRRFQLPHRWGA